MPPTTRQKTKVTVAPAAAVTPAAAATAPTPLIDATPAPAMNNGATSQYKDDDPFEREFNNNDDVGSDHDSDHSNFQPGSKRKGSLKPGLQAKKHRTVPRREPAPELPDLSDDEETRTSSANNEVGHVWSTKYRAPSDDWINIKELPEMVLLRVYDSLNEGSLVDLNPRDLILSARGAPAGTILPPERKATNVEPKAAVVKNKKSGSSVRVGFLDLPFELRMRIYRKAFRGDAPVDFHERNDFSRSSAFLRTCKTVHEEGRQVLYGENSFHFSRNLALRGAYWESDWKEVAYKDVRRFLGAIGLENISLLKYVSFTLSDGNPHVATDVFERKFVHDATVQHIFHLLGANATFQKLSVCFAGRCQVATSDFYFMKAFTEMRCHNMYILTRSRGHTNRMAGNIKQKLLNIMELPRASGHAGGLIPNSNQVKMFFEYDTITWGQPSFA